MDLCENGNQDLTMLRTPLDGRTYCEHCKRGFNQKAYERHLERCQNKAKEAAIKKKFAEQQHARMEQQKAKSLEKANGKTPA